MIKYIIPLFIMIALVGCSKKAAPGNSQADYKDKAYQALNVPTVDFYENSKNDFVLATYQNQSGVPGSEPLHFVVIKIEDNSVVKKQTLANGSVKWVDDYLIEIVSPPGIPKGNNETIADYTTQFNVQTGKPVSKVSVKN